MKYDVVIIGGGPAGLMAAGRAGELGARVLLLEKNHRLGAKLMLTGNGRCNITNKISTRELIGIFGVNGKFLFSALNKFGVDETIDFFQGRGVKIKIENDNKVFPVSDKAGDVLNALIQYLKKSGVEIKTDAQVKEIVGKPPQLKPPLNLPLRKGEKNTKGGENKIEKLILTSGEEIIADKFIICTGGQSYPATGSTGDGYRWLKKLGHQIVLPAPSLTPIIVKEKFVKELEGLSLKNVEIKIYKGNKKIGAEFGDAIFTADGLSGPAILNLSRKVNRELANQIKLRIDFELALDFVQLDQKIQKHFQAGNNKLIKNCLEDLLPKKLASVILKLSKISPAKKVNLINREERKKIVRFLKEFDLEVKGLAGYDQAMVTAGGVDLREVDPKTMKSKIIDNLYLAGEILDLDGPTGGYNLQACWSTGYAAGESVVAR